MYCLESLTTPLTTLTPSFIWGKHIQYKNLYNAVGEIQKEIVFLLGVTTAISHSPPCHINELHNNKGMVSSGTRLKEISTRGAITVLPAYAAWRL